jgi:copper chaperone CopZ
METTTNKKQSFRLEGMTCGSCVNRVTQGLQSVAGVVDAKVSLNPQRAEVEFDQAVAVDELQKAIGHYKLSLLPTENLAAPPKSDPPGATESKAPAIPEANVTTYRPLIMIISFIAGVTLLAQYPFEDFSGSLWMRHFMAGFFIVFAFFKLLNLRGFADSYAMYDIVAAKWRGWGFVYPFIELGLGILYLINVAPFWTNVLTIVILGVSSIGVIQSNLNKRKIKCACLGDVFNLPMSTVTIVEDVGMVLMAILMITQL